MAESAAQDLKTINDPRGSLTVAETGAGLPFAVQRMFIVHDAPAGTTRGYHAHRTCHQFLVATSGAVEVVLDDGSSRRSVRLAGPAQGLHIPPGVWGEQTYLEPGTVLVVLTSDTYDKADYISDYDEFVAFTQGGQ